MLLVWAMTPLGESPQLRGRLSAACSGPGLFEVQPDGRTGGRDEVVDGGQAWPKASGAQWLEHLPEEALHAATPETADQLWHQRVTVERPVYRRCRGWRATPRWCSIRRPSNWGGRCGSGGSVQWTPY
jgi:hypothetical protein